MKDYLKKERQRKNAKQENMETEGFYKTKKEMELEMGKHKRQVLQKVASLYKNEKEEFYQKYRTF